MPSISVLFRELFQNNYHDREVFSEPLIHAYKRYFFIRVD
jgi:hypothetical protein